MNGWRRVAGVAAMLLAPCAAWGSGVQASLDRSTVQLGETVTLNVQVQGAGSSITMPDLESLRKDFTILGTSQNRSVSIVNGKSSSSMTIGVALRPEHVGTLVVPSLSVDGERTAPLQLVVEPPSPGAANAMHGDVFLQAQITPAQGYVGEQFSYVQRLYYAVNISSGTLDPPRADGVEVRQLGDDLNYSAQRGGRDYHVLERRYALTPQRAGRIAIPAVDFRGDSADPMDPNSFFGSSTPVSATAPGVSIEVQAPPSTWGSADWLPARQLTLSIDGWPGAHDPVHVGQVLNLSMTMRATGLPAEALPALSMPGLAGATIYPGTATQTNHPDGQWLLGQRQRTFAIVPSQAGTLTIPATTVQWWNVLTSRVEVAQVPAHQLSVLPALGTTAGATPATTASAPAAGAEASAAGAGGHDTLAWLRAWPWRWIAVICLGLGVSGALLWWWRRRRVTRVAPRATPEVSTVDSARRCRLRFLAAARGSDVAMQAHSLLAWARAERPSVRNLGGLQDELADASQRHAIAQLQLRLYGDGPAAAGTLDLVGPFKRGFHWKAAPDAGDDGALSPLYPFKLS